MSTFKRITHKYGLCVYASILCSAQVIADETPSFDFDGLLMLDYDNFSEHFLEDSEQGADDAYLRRASFAVKSQLTPLWSAKLKIDVKDGIELKDAFIKYKGWSFADVTLGKHKEPFGLERQMSSKNLLFNERSFVSNAIAPSRAYGLSLSGQQSIFNWQLGYFVRDSEQSDDYESAITGKLSLLAWENKRGRLHLGTSFSGRHYPSDSQTTFRINETMDVYGADSLIEGVEFTPDQAKLNGVELLWQYRGFTALAEWQQADVMDNQGNTYLYDGGATQLSYMLSGKNRKYKNGVLGGVSKKSDWEITARYNKFNLHEENSETTALSVGVNYYLNKDFKFSADLIQANYVDDGEDLGDGQAVSVRFQYQF